MRRERATVFLVDFRHPLLKVEKKWLPIIAEIYKKVDFKAWEKPLDMALPDWFHCKGMKESSNKKLI